MEEFYDYRRGMLERFAGVGEDLAKILAKISQDDSQVSLEPDAWTIHQYMANLRDLEEQAFLPSIERILEEETPLLEHFDDARWIAAHYQFDEPLESLLESYRDARSKELDCIKDMPQCGWNRIGRHPLWGLRTLQWWVEHSLAHSERCLRQIALGVQSLPLG